MERHLHNLFAARRRCRWLRAMGTFRFVWAARRFVQIIQRPAVRHPYGRYGMSPFRSSKFSCERHPAATPRPRGTFRFVWAARRCVQIIQRPAVRLSYGRYGMSPFRSSKSSWERHPAATPKPRGTFRFVWAARRCVQFIQRPAVRLSYGRYGMSPFRSRLEGAPTGGSRGSGLWLRYVARMAGSHISR